MAGQSTSVSDDMVWTEKKLVGNSLIGMYMSCKCIFDAFQVFELMRLRDVVTWSSLIAGCAEQGRIEDTVYTSIILLYAKGWS